MKQNYVTVSHPRPIYIRTCIVPAAKANSVRSDVFTEQRRRINFSATVTATTNVFHCTAVSASNYFQDATTFQWKVTVALTC